MYTHPVATSRFCPAPLALPIRHLQRDITAPRDSPPLRDANDVLSLARLFGQAAERAAPRTAVWPGPHASAPATRLRGSRDGPLASHGP
jgi:hypothetical protein